MYFVYMIKNSVNKLYIGITENPQNRLFAHNSKRGANFTKFLPNYKIVFLEEYPKLTAARQREVQLKKWSRTKKEFLIDLYHKKLETKPPVIEL